MKKIRSEMKVFGLIATLVSVLSASGCSPGSLFGNQTDTGIQNQAAYRKVNTQCSNIDLSRSHLDVTTARKLMGCLDSQGALGGFGKLVKAMSDDELAPFVVSLNRSFIDAPENLYKVDHTLNDLKARGELDSALAGIGGLLQDDELIMRSVSIFHKSYAASGSVDPELLFALQRLARELTPEHVADLLDLGQLATDARSFNSLWTHLDDSRPLSPAIAEGLVAYGRSSSHIGRELIDHLLDGSIFSLIDAIVPDDSNGIRMQAPRWDSILEHSLAEQGHIASQLGYLFAGLSAPVPCMKSARALRYSPMDVIGELTALPSQQARAFIERDKLAQLYVAYPLCSFPDSVASGYHALVELAGTPAIEPLTDILRSAYQVTRGNQRPVADFLVRALGDPAFQNLLPALGELQARGAWNDLLLLATAPQIKDRSKITGALKVLVDPLPAASGKTIFDVLVQGLTRVEPSELTGWLKSFRATDSGLAASMRGLRSMYYVNDTHALLNLARNAMADAPNDTALINALLKVSARAEFQASVKELSLMAADGRLKDMLTTTLTLFKRYAAGSQCSVIALAPGASLPALRFPERHQLRASDLSAWRTSDPLADFGACEKIDFSVGWNQVDSLSFEDQLQNVTTCISSDGNYKELADSLRLLGREQTQQEPGTSSPSRTIHALLVDAYNAFQFTASEAGLLADWGLAALNDGRVLRALQGVPVLVHHTVIRPMIDLAAPLITDLNARTGLRRLGIYGASVLKRLDLQNVVAYVDDLYRAHPAIPAAPTRAAYDRERLLRWISNKECTILPATSDAAALTAAKNARYAGIVNEYETAVVNDGPYSADGLRKSWTTAELKEQLDPIFAKFADVKGNGPLARSLMRFAARFGDPAQYSPGYLEKWLRKRADDRRMIGYIYPGETVPRVRLVNGLDRLSLALANANLDAGDPIGNFGMQFLANIADAWGDVKFEKRPAEIQAKFPKNGPSPLTLSDTIANIASTATSLIQMVGLPPTLPQCTQVADTKDPVAVQQAETTDPVRPPSSDDNPYLPDPDAGTPEAAQRAVLQAHLYNVAETISSLKETVDDGGMALLRDLFFDLYYTGPTANQDPAAGLKNNLSVAMRLVDLGLLRQIGLLIADTPADDLTIHAFFQGLIDGAASSEIGAVAETLFTVQPKQDLIWGVIDQIVKLKDPNDLANAKSFGINGLASLSSLGRARSSETNELLDPLLHALKPILDKNSDLIAKHVSLFGDLITWSDGADFLRALAVDRSATRANMTDLIKDAVSDTQRGLDLMAMLQSVDANGKALQGWDDFRANWKSLDQVPEWRSLKLSEIGRQALNFLEARSADGKLLPAEQAALSRKMLLTTATLLERGNMELVDQLLALAQRQPDQFYELIDSTSKLIENGEIPRLLDLVQAKLGPAVAI